jgi:hypothetical protein
LAEPWSQIPQVWVSIHTAQVPAHTVRLPVRLLLVRHPVDHHMERRNLRPVVHRTARHKLRLRKAAVDLVVLRNKRQAALVRPLLIKVSAVHRKTLVVLVDNLAAAASARHLLEARAAVVSDLHQAEIKAVSADLPTATSADLHLAATSADLHLAATMVDLRPVVATGNNRHKAAMARHRAAQQIRTDHQVAHQIRTALRKINTAVASRAAAHPWCPSAVAAPSAKSETP